MYSETPALRLTAAAMAGEKHGYCGVTMIALLRASPREATI